MRDFWVATLLAAACFTMTPVAQAQDVRAWCPDGYKAFVAERFEAANLALSACLYEPPEDAELAAGAYVMRGLTYAAADDTEAALNDFDRAVDLMPQNAVAWREKARVHYRLGDLHPAIESIEQSLAIDPNNTESHHVHAQILTTLERPELAMDAYDLGYSFETKDRVRRLQENLAGLGYAIGAADGVYGRRTRDALKACIADGCTFPF